MTSTRLAPTVGFTAHVPPTGRNVPKAFVPRKPKPWEAMGLPDDLDFVFDPNELCRKLERYKFAQEECARRRRQRLLDDEKRRKQTEEGKTKAVDRQKQLEKLVPAVQPTSNSSSTTPTTPRFIPIDTMVKEKQEEHQRTKDAEKQRVDEAFQKREAERKRIEDARKQRDEVRRRKEEELKRKEHGVKSRQQKPVAPRHGESHGPSKISAFIAFQKPIQQETERRQSHRPQAAKLTQTERKHDSAPPTATSRQHQPRETAPYHHVPRFAKSDFQRTATADPLRKKNVHQLALPMLDKRSSFHEASTSEWGDSLSSDKRFSGSLSPPLNWLHPDKRFSGSSGHPESLPKSESESDGELAHQYQPHDRPDWAQSDQEVKSTNQSWTSRPSFTSSKHNRTLSGEADRTAPTTELKSLSYRKSLLGLKSIFGK